MPNIEINVFFRSKSQFLMQNTVIICSVNTFNTFCIYDENLSTVQYLEISQNLFLSFSWFYFDALNRTIRLFDFKLEFTDVVT